MKYDRDIFWSRILLFVLLAANLLMSIKGGIRHDWYTVTTGVLWTGNFLCLLWWSRTVQQHRDQSRLIAAALQQALTTNRLEGLEDQI